jgi:hypothetical protein
LAFRANAKTTTLPRPSYSHGNFRRVKGIQTDFFSWQFLSYFKAFTRQKISYSKITFDPISCNFLIASSKSMLIRDGDKLHHFLTPLLILASLCLPFLIHIVTASRDIKFSMWESSKGGRGEFSSWSRRRD